MVIFVAVILLGAGVLVNLLIGKSPPFPSPTTFDLLSSLAQFLQSAVC